ncbi:hypothetical protein [Halioxenophilus aromaticivorans]|uniref:Pesticin C-terminal domain-containing protein n=1 Tax=Halioxenophilus aromaticivorans TaxID=1306992 RepID=A0AAV3TZU8_9ALTE
MPLDPKIKRDVLASLELYEGRSTHLYLDTLGNVTVGVGHFVANRGAIVSVQLYKKDAQGNNVVASLAEKQAEYDNIARQSYGVSFAAGYYKQFTKLFMLNIDIDAQREAHLKSFFKELAGYYNVANGFKSDFENMPLEVQKALFDMVFNVGLPSLISGFPQLDKAIKTEQWDVAANQCSRKGLSPARNSYCKNLFNLAHNLSATVP